METTASDQPASDTAPASSSNGPPLAAELCTSAPTAALRTTRRPAHPNHDPEPEHISADYVDADPLAPLPIPPPIPPVPVPVPAPAGARRAPHGADEDGDPEHASVPFAAANGRERPVYRDGGKPGASE
ncbi:hypothetical protein PsYK624_061260 [Phanerochaete sordida]|uniref:Uncharacterized protein n=1 Tax=Phanerochaete sordida TaxID=48140 RepID=A0A9P3G8R9_9APHY|nr:hypothetical protein PsYK624_061260 [Phanerochaete sordida]